MLENYPDLPEHAALIEHLYRALHNPNENPVVRELILLKGLYFIATDAKARGLVKKVEPR